LGPNAHLHPKGAAAHESKQLALFSDRRSLVCETYYSEHLLYNVSLGTCLLRPGQHDNIVTGLADLLLVALSRKDAKASDDGGRTY
jgi:predicted ATPase